MGFFDFLKKDSSAAVPTSVAVQEGFGILVQPIDGEVIPLTDIGDGVFSEGILGNGCGLIPSAEAVYAPVSGVISSIADTKHAIGIEADGAEVLIHVGMETVSMNGKGFNVKVKEGETVKAGQLLLTFSKAEIEAAEGVRTTTAVVVNNSDDFPDFKIMRTGTGKAGEPLIRVKQQP